MIETKYGSAWKASLPLVIIAAASGTTWVKVLHQEIAKSYLMMVTPNEKTQQPTGVETWQSTQHLPWKTK